MRDGSVGIVTRLWAGQQRENSSVPLTYLSILYVLRTGPGANRTLYLVGNGGSSLGAKWPVREADRLNAEVKNVWSYTSTPYMFS